MSPTSITVLAAALAVLVGACLAFGHRYGDKSNSFDQKPKADELNDIRIAMRSESTIPVIEKLWCFLVETQQKLAKEGLSLDVGSLLYDTSRREHFNKLINDLEKTLKESMNIKDSWDELRIRYAQLGNALYGFSAVVGIAGYSFLINEALSLTPLSVEQLKIAVAAFAIFCILFLVIALKIRQKMTSSEATYKKARMKYLIEEPRIG